MQQDCRVLLDKVKQEVADTNGTCEYSHLSDKSTEVRQYFRCQIYNSGTDRGH